MKHTIIIIDVAHPYSYDALAPLLAELDQAMADADLEVEDWKMSVKQEERLL